MLQVSCGRDRDVVGGVRTVVVVEQHLPSKLLDRFLRAQDRPAQTVSLPEVPDERFVKHELRLVGLHLDFLKNDALFLLDIFVAEQRIQNQVREHIERIRKVLV